MISLTRPATAQTLLLSDRLLWADEFAWSPVAMETRWGTTGQLMLHQAERQAGRPITLEGVESEAWLTRLVVRQLNDWAALPGEPFTLLLRGAQHTVLFDHARAPAFDAKPVFTLLDGIELPTDWYRPTFNFIEIQS